MTSIAGPMTFEQYSKNPPKQNGYQGNYQRTGDVQQDYQNYANQEGFDLYQGMMGNQDAYDRYNAKHGTTHGQANGNQGAYNDVIPFRQAAGNRPDMTTYGSAGQQQGSGSAGFDMGSWMEANGFAGYEQPEQQQPEQQQFANLTMAPDSTPEQVEQANKNWMNWMQTNAPTAENSAAAGQTEHRGGQLGGDSRLDSEFGSPTISQSMYDRMGGRFNDYGATPTDPPYQPGGPNATDADGADRASVYAGSRKNPYGFTPPNPNMNVTTALVPYHNPTTGETWTAPSGGYKAPKGWKKGPAPSSQGQDGQTQKDGSRTIMPGETSEDSEAITDFGNSNVDGAPSSQADKLIETQISDLFPENFNIEEMMKRVPGTEDMSMEDFVKTFDPRARVEGMPAPEGVAETEYGDGIVRTQSFDQYLQPKGDPAFGADINSLGNMGNNIFDVRRPAAFESSFPDPFGRATNPTTYSSGMQGVMANQSHETAFATLLGSMQQQQAENMRGRGVDGYMPIDIQALYDYAGTAEGQEMAAETFANDQMKFNKIMGY